MRWRFLIVLGLGWPLAGQGATLELSVGDVAGPGWQAQGVLLQLDPRGATRLHIDTIRLAGAAASIIGLQVDCPQPLAADHSLRCEHGRVAASLPGIGAISGEVRAAYVGAQQWSLSAARLNTPFGPLALDLATTPQGLSSRLRSTGLDLALLARAAKVWGLRQSFSIAGQAGLDLRLLLAADGGGTAQYQVRLSGLTLSEPSGQRASDKLTLTLDGSAATDGKTVRVNSAFALPSGQFYWEPLFADFAAHPLQGRAELAWTARQHRLDLVRLGFTHTGVAEGELSGTLDPAQAAGTANLQVRTLTARFPGFYEVYLKPLLAGKPYEDLQTAGSATLVAGVAQGRPQHVELELRDFGVDSQRLDLGLQGLSGHMVWDATAVAGESQLDWREARFGKLPLAASGLRFRTGPRDFALTAPWRQPVLDGALSVGHLALQHIGEPALEAQFDARIEPISLERLCHALGWPEFSGQLSGALPGLRLRQGVLALDGALTAQVFDGAVAVTGLRVADPFGPLPQLSADLRLRSLDLAALTGAFSFGRIEGRLDGDVDALRLLAWRPVAFKARINTPPGDDSRHRISQRAIDNISSIGGGPTGLLSRGFMSVFKEFSYDRIGWSCVLDNGVCRMDGIEPAPNGGYYLVKGRWLPRIDVIGNAHEVSWEALLQQVDNVRHAQAPQVR